MWLARPDVTLNTSRMLGVPSLRSRTSHCRAAGSNFGATLGVEVDELQRIL
jgi:hypothetical protein